MFWNDPKLYSANIPTNYFYPPREVFNYQTQFLPWQQFGRTLPFEHFGRALPFEHFAPTQQFGRTLPFEHFAPTQQFGRTLPFEHFAPTQFNYPKFDIPMNFLPYMTYGYMDRPQFPFYKPYFW